MTMRMLIDARHREETRVAVVNGSRIEEFDFESAERKQLKGNIYLAKVTRVEPSLQAAFIDYGGNRHGFLAFSEIHPDYYQIPKEDRDALLREEAEHAAEEEALRAREDEHDEDGDADDDADAHDAEGDEGEDAPRPQAAGAKGSGDESAVETLRERRTNLRHRYKIQDVIRRRQVLLVQVVKEERGNKGAALTTYLSLAGRYCVLMPNTSHGGGISRKISNSADRKRLKSIMADLNLPKTMGCIVRTAGLQRTKTEIKRDFDYLARLWDEIREKTLQSAAPALVYQDSDLIKRAIRDIYNRDIEEVIVEGDEGYRAARNFMKLLMPSHVKKVKQYIDRVPLFQRGRVEEQLSAMYQPVVQLKSGGYLVINPTEALVSIDINSGRSTREHNIEQTALSTNLEAADEIARQLRLRDMAGLVVVDFIDMESNSNNRKVEKAMKNALANDRARIQVGRISGFGLFEMSRQRLRTGVLEASTRGCPHCEGTGLVRTASSAGLQALRIIEDAAASGRGSQLLLRASQEAAFYVLNRKRTELGEIEVRYGVTIEIVPDGSIEGARMTVDIAGPPPVMQPILPLPAPQEDDDDEIEDEIVEEEDEDEEIAADRGEEPSSSESTEDRDGSRRKRRRRRRRGGRRDEGDTGAEQGDESAEAEGEAADGEGAEPAPVAAGGTEEDGEGRRRRGRRGRRGGRRHQFEAGNGELSSEPSELAADIAEAAEPEQPAPEPEVVPEPVAAAPEAAPRPRRRPRARKEPIADVTEAVADAPVEAPAIDTPAEAPAKAPRRTRKPAAAAAVAPVAAPVESDAGPAPEAEAPKPKRRSRAKAGAAAPTVADAAPADEPVTAVVPADAAPIQDDADASAEDGDGGPPRRGWWQRTFGA